MLEVIFLSDILLAAIAVVWLIVATIQDIKKREVANWLNFSLIIIALGIRGLAAIMTNNAYYFLNALLFLAVFFIIANIMYYGRIFAGGDAKLLIALGVVFSTTPSFAMQIGNQTYQVLQFMIPFKPHFLLTFFINLLFIGSLYGVIYSITLSLTHRKAFLKEFRKITKKRGFLQFTCLFLALLFLIVALFNKETVLWIIAASLALFPYLFIFVKSVENSCMLRVLKPKELTEGDWLAIPVKLKIRRTKHIIKPNWQGLSKKEIALIKKAKIKNVVIKQGVPFVPVFLIALILSFFTNLLLFFMQFFI